MRTVILVILSSMACWAADPKLHSARLSTDSSNEVLVQFETPVALSDCDVVFPRANGCGSLLLKAPWTVVVYDKSGAASVDEVSRVADDVGELPANGVVTITLKDPIVAGFLRVDITFVRGGKSLQVTLGPTSKPTKHWITAAKTKDDSDVYISGTFAPAQGTSPSYTIDSKGKYTMLTFGNNGTSTLSALGQISTDNKKTADPDSFSWSIPVQSVYPGNYSLQWPSIGMEMNKKASAINLVSAPSVTGSIVHDFYVNDKANPGTTRIGASWGMDLTGGLEFGDNLRNAIAVANKSGKGEGWFLRGVPSTSIYLIFPQLWRLNKISVSSSYTARIPARDELFLETRHQTKPLPLLTSQTRHYIQNSLQFMLTDYFGIQIKHTYGSLPPAFTFVQNSGSIGLVFAFKQARVP